MMQVPGKRVRLTRWIHADACVVRVEVDAIIPDADPSEPCIEPAAVNWLKEVRERADAGDISWLEHIGTVYVRQPMVEAR